MNIYVTRDGTTHGPYTEIQAREYLKQGIFSDDDLACHEGASEWQPLSTLIRSPANFGKAKQPAVERSQANPYSPLVVFLAGFFGVTLAGGVLMLGWQFFLRDKIKKTEMVSFSAKPTPAEIVSTAPKSPPTETVSAPAKPTIVEKLFDRKCDLSGEVFIVTKGGQNYKLGLVPISLFSNEAIQPYLDEKKKVAAAELARLKPLVTAAKSDSDRKEIAERAAFDAYLNADYSSPNRNKLDAAHKLAQDQASKAQSAYFELIRQQSRYLSGHFYFSDFPKPLVTSQTNADGRFTIEIPAKGEFVVAANAKRSVGDSTERYFWLIKVSLDGDAKKAIMLSNNNLTSESAPDSLIQTDD